MSLTFQPFLAPAKLNLMLRILGSRADGYHNLETVFRLIDLADTIEIALPSNHQITLMNPHTPIPSPKNLILHAAQLLQAVTNSNQGATLRLTKRIPIGAGLGGGSSDAATTLMALNQLWQTGLSRQALMALGKQLGADVPFFIFGQNAYGQGIGDELTALTLPDRWYVLLHPPVKIATKRVFSLLKLTSNTPPAIMPALLDASFYRNDLEPVVRKHFRQVEGAITALAEYGAARMTGSGSCVFLECHHATHAQQILETCTGNWQGYLVRGLSQHPLYGITASAGQNNWGVAKW